MIRPVVTLRLTLNVTVVPSGGTLLVSAHVQNPTAQVVTIWSSGLWPNTKIAIINAQGKEMPLSDDGRLRRKAFAPAGDRDKNVAIPVAPGAKAELFRDIAPFKLYSSLAPGAYLLEVTYHDAHLPTPLLLTARKKFTLL